jgi:subtilisin family serine protease
MKNTSTLALSVLFSLSAQAALPIFSVEKSLPELTNEQTPSFVLRQNHLLPAPRGVGAQAVWSLPGGRGENVKIIDIETGFNETHEDLLPFWVGAVPQDSDHGTAVMGILGAPDNGFGVVGIAPMSQTGFFGFIEGNQDRVDAAYIAGITKAIRESVAQLGAGDVLVIEQHMMGPDNSNWTAVEYWPEIFAELKAATDKGIHCVAAAGNGYSNLDAPAYKGAFDLSKRDSGCIVVGAGSQSAHERLGFSNYGSRVDAHGYGEGVTTTGYGQLFNAGKNATYTASFNGTSSATPIVAGAVALVSSIAKAQGKTITPIEMRAALRASGTPQGSRTVSQRIGNMPDVPALLGVLKLQ